jgi:hypothetical protein
MGVNLSLANNFIKGEIYQNNIKNVFGTKVTISFPPGKWKVVKTSNFSQLYTNTEFRNTKDGAVLKIGLPNQTISGKFTSRIKKCKYDNEYTLHATGIIRSGLHSRYCIKSDKNWLMIELDGMTLRGTGIFAGYYNIFYPVKKSIVASLSKDKLESIGISFMQAFRKNVKGQAGDYSAVKELLSFNDNLQNSTSSYNSTSSNSKYVPLSKSMSSLSDKEVCTRATVSNGLGWENVNSNFADYVKEAFNRKLSLYECRKLTDRFPKTETIAETESEESSLKNKLKELKSMLDEGLISQELYDTKSAKLLEDF